MDTQREVLNLIQKKRRRDLIIFFLRAGKTERVQGHSNNSSRQKEKILLTLKKKMGEGNNSNRMR